MKNGQVFLSGMLISFFAALPLGVFNIAALQILIGKGLPDALFFITGCIMAEMIYLRISLHDMHRIAKYERLLKMISWIFLVFIIVMAVSSFSSANQDLHLTYLESVPPFILGFLLMALNISQIPFWFGWNAVLFIKKILVTKQSCYNIYALGICFGSFIGYGLFIAFGQFVAGYVHSSQFALNAVIGCIFSLAAIIHYLKMRSGAVSSTERVIR